MNKEELNIHCGTHIWKSGLEYHNEHTFLHGYPYYEITKVDDIYYLWELDLNDPNPSDYRIVQQSDNFISLHEKGMELDQVLGEKYEALNLYYLRGKELLEKLKSAQ